MKRATASSARFIVMLTRGIGCSPAAFNLLRSMVKQFKDLSEKEGMGENVTMRRTALMIVLAAVLAPMVAGGGVSMGSAVNDVAISADGRYAVAGTDGGMIACLRQDGSVAWDTSAGDPVTAVAVADARGYVAAGTNAGDVILLDGASGNRYWTERVTGPVRDLAFSGDGRSLAVGSSRVTLFDHQGKEGWNFSTGAGATVSRSSSPPYPGGQRG